MKILFTCHRYAPLVGGYEAQIQSLAEGLSQFHDVKVLTFNLTQSPRIEHIGGVEVHRVTPSLVFFRVPLTPVFLSSLNTLDFDVLHAHGAIPCVSDLSVLYAKLIKHTGAIYTHHFDGSIQDSRALNLLARFYSKSVGHFSAGFCDHIIATSRSYAETSMTIKPFLDKVTIIPCSVDPQVFLPQSPTKTDTLRKRLGLIGKQVVLFVGRIVPYKGLEYLVKAMEHIQQTDKDFQLLVVGGGEGRKITNPSYYLPRIRAYVNKRGLRDHITFLGRVTAEALPLYYSLGDVLVLPSVMRGEAFGTVLLEAMSCGTPVVASRIPGVQDVLQGNNYIGSYVPPRDAYTLAEAITKMAPMKGKVQARCREFVKENYATEKIIEKYTALYDSLH